MRVGQVLERPNLHLVVDNTKQLTETPHRNNLLDELMFTELRTTRSTPERSVQDDIDRIILKNNFIPIHGVITSELADEVRIKTQLLAAAMKKTDKIKPVHFLINSPGGEIMAMNSILDSMDRLKNTKINGQNIIVATYCDGMAASAASVILANGTQGYRFISPRSEVMIHQPLGKAEGQASDIEIRARHIIKHKELLVDFFSKVTKVSREDLKDLMERDHYMDAKECLEKGFVDHVYDSFATEEEDNLDIDKLFGEEKK